MGSGRYYDLADTKINAFGLVWSHDQKVTA